MKLWLRAATCVTVIFLIGWYFVYGQDMSAEISNAQLEQKQSMENYQTMHKICDDFRHGRETEYNKTPIDKQANELLCRDGSYTQPPKMISARQMTKDGMKPVIEILLVIWGFFAGLQWLIRGAL
jgi:hypothetical protein